MVERFYLLRCVVGMLLLCAAGEAGAWAADDRTPLQTRGPLRPSAENPRYFADAENRPVYLTGSHS